MTPNRKKGWNGFRYGAMAKALLFCFLIGGSGVGYVWLRHQVHALGQQIHQLERRLEELGSENSKLARVQAALQSPRSLEGRAKALNLGLVPPSPEQVWHVSERNTNSTAIYPTNLRTMSIAQTTRQQ